MSDDFDKEAEREKLREKYESEAADREATERMSELLLKGATMTNKHCGNCGDPIFRHDGQEFCPTCAHETSASAEQSTTGDARQPAGDARQPAGDARQPAGDAHQNADEASQQAAHNADQPAGGPTPNAADASARRQRTQEADGGAAGVEADADATATTQGRNASGRRTDVLDGDNSDVRPQRAPGRDQRGEPAPEHAQRSRSPTGSVPVDATAISQVETTIERFAAEAASTDDPARARECLDVVRTAAETLRVLRADQA